MNLPINVGSNSVTYGLLNYTNKTESGGCAFFCGRLFYANRDILIQSQVRFAQISNNAANMS